MKMSFPREVRSIILPNQIEIPYVEQGNPSGICLILVHGYADSWRSFELLLPYLPESFHTFALTQRGHGDASRPSDGYQTNDFAADLFLFMNALQIDSAVIVGGSSGGFVARHFAIDNPRRILGLALLGSPYTLFDKPGLETLWESTISKLTDPVDPSFVSEFQRGVHVSPVSESFLQTMISESLKVPAFVWQATFKGLLADNSHSMLAKIEAPTLIIWGDQDTVVPFDDQEKLKAAIEKSSLLVYPGTGHAIYWESPKQIVFDLEVFIENLTS